MAKKTIINGAAVTLTEMSSPQEVLDVILANRIAINDIYDKLFLQIGDFETRITALETSIKKIEEIENGNKTNNGNS